MGGKKGGSAQKEAAAKEKANAEAAKRDAAEAADWGKGAKNSKKSYVIHFIRTLTPEILNWGE